MRFFPSMSDTIRWVASPGTRMIDALVFGGFAGVSRRGFAGVRCTDVCQVASGVMTPVFLGGGQFIVWRWLALLIYGLPLLCAGGASPGSDPVFGFRLWLIGAADGVCERREARVARREEERRKLIGSR